MSPWRHSDDRMRLVEHTTKIINRANNRINFLRCLSGLGVASDTLVFTYNSIIRPILEIGYAITYKNRVSTVYNSHKTEHYV